MGKVCEHQVLDLNPLPKPISTPEPLLDFSQFPESILVPVLSESKSVIHHFTLHPGTKVLIQKTLKLV